MISFFFGVSAAFFACFTVSCFTASSLPVTFFSNSFFSNSFLSDFISDFISGFMVFFSVPSLPASGPPGPLPEDGCPGDSLASPSGFRDGSLAFASAPGFRRGSFSGSRFEGAAAFASPLGAPPPNAFRTSRAASSSTELCAAFASTPFPCRKLRISLFCTSNSFASSCTLIFAMLSSISAIDGALLLFQLLYNGIR